MLHPTARSASRLLCSLPERSACRHAAILAIHPVGRPAPAAHQRPPRQPPRQPPRSHAFSTARVSRNKDNSSPSAPPLSSALTPDSSKDGDDDVPWYLKVNVPKHASLTPSETVLPEVPAGAPAIMEPLLSFIADDMGLDDLALLDLRALDPPAALGPGLLMLFGTARSERHLHVSADRLVRWLRKSGIDATADGLLGRNELKIKLRRKARRAKLIGSFSAPGTAPVLADGDSVDDGISTQWVCLNAGTLGRSGSEGSVIDADGRTTGFGHITHTGTTLVVQMLTQAKRRQLDLETLWSHALQRNLKEQAELARLLPLAPGVSNEVDSDPQVGKTIEVSVQETVQESTSSSHPPPSIDQQRRLFSTSSRRFAFGSSSVVARLMQPILDPTELARIDEELASDRQGKIQLLDRLAKQLEDSLETPESYLVPGSRLGKKVAAKDLPQGVTADFARMAAYCSRGLSAADTWAFRSRVHGIALCLGQPGYTLAGMNELVREMQLSGIQLSRQQAVLLLRRVLSVRTKSGSGGPLPTAESASVSTPGSEEAHVHELQTEIVQRLIDTLHDRGQSVMANDVLVASIVSLASANRALLPQELSLTNVPVHHGSKQAHEMQAVLERLLWEQASRLPCPSEEELASLLHAYVIQGNWEQFWLAWRLPTRFCRARSRFLYTALFRMVAWTGSQKRCMEALRRCVHEMPHEQPPVEPTGSLMRAMVSCIRIADPDVERKVRALETREDASSDRLAKSEFVRLIQAVVKHD